MSFVKHDKYPILKWKYVSICPFLGKFLNFTIKRKRKKLLWKIIWSVGGLNPGLLGERQLWLPQDYGDPRNSGKNVFIVIANEHCFKKANLWSLVLIRLVCHIAYWNSMMWLYIKYSRVLHEKLRGMKDSIAISHPEVQGSIFLSGNLFF